MAQSSSSSSSLLRRASDRHLIVDDIGPLRMAKAKVTGDDIDWMRAVAIAVYNAMVACGWGVKELAAKVDKDEAEVSRWIAGIRRPQIDVLIAVDELHEPLVVELARLRPQKFVIRTTIETRRSA